MTWHPPPDQLGIMGWGQRLDHFVTSNELLNGENRLAIASITNFRGVRSSDHNPLMITLKRDSKNKQQANEIEKTIASDWISTVVIRDLDSKTETTFNSIECPRITVVIAGKETEVFCDSGSPFSIYNPPAGKKTNDHYLRESKPTGSLKNCQFSGVGGGAILAEQNYSMSVVVGEKEINCNFVVLRKHEPSLPLFLIGMDILVGHLRGFAILPSGNKEASVRFGLDWNQTYKCKRRVESRKTTRSLEVPLYPLFLESEREGIETCLDEVCKMATRVKE